jgi:primase/DNA polymerase family protein/DNA primase RepB-like protein
MTGACDANALAEFLAAIHGVEPGLLGLLSLDRRAASRQARERFVAYPDRVRDAAAWLGVESLAGRDVYACAHLLSAMRRIKAHALPLRSLYADVDHDRLPHQIPPPSVIVASSPERWQAYWRLTEPVAPMHGETLNRRLALAVGADPSGVDLTQVLRVPATRNFKYADAPVVTLVRLDTVAYEPEELEAALPPLPAERAGPTNSHAEPSDDSSLADTQVLAEAMGARNGAKVRALYRGDWSGYPSQSEADLALCALLAFWTRDPAQIDRLFRLSGLMRDKWDERHFANDATYGEETVARAMSGRNPTWSGGLSSREAGGQGDDGGNEARSEKMRIDAADQHLPQITPQAWTALEAANAPAPRLFQFAGAPVRVACPHDDVPRVETLTEDRMRHELARAADWYKASTKNGAVLTMPPLPVVRDLLASPTCPLPRLDRIIEAPAFAPDGSLPTIPGYHPPGRTYYAPAPSLAIPSVPTAPTRIEIQAARALLLDELLGDFPFTGEAERAHALALLLLPLMRDLIAGPTPLHLIEKPTAGTGAGLFVDVIAIVATGRSAAPMTEGRDEDEWRKRLTAVLRSGAALVVIDNLRRRLDSGSVAAALTATTWQDRLLGASDIVALPVRCAWIATGNNPALSSEIARRSVRIRMDAKQDRPWLRRGFRHPNLRGWAAERRGNLLAACLILGQAWLAAGRPAPAPGTPELGSFEAWSRVLGGVLMVAETPGFLANLAEFYERSDVEGEAVRGFLRAWWELHRDGLVGVAQLFTLATAPESGLDLGEKGEHSQRIRLGQRLRELRDRFYQLTPELGVRVADAGTEHRAQLWRLAATFDRTNTEEQAADGGEWGE